MQCKGFFPDKVIKTWKWQLDEAAYHVQIEEKEVDLNSYVCPANTLDVIVVSR